VSTITLMVVDDHRMVADGLASVLEADPGLAVIARAASGGEALALAPHSRPDAVVVDLRLPDMTGVELATRLRALCPALPVVLISASFTRDALDAAMAAGISVLASKLASGEELVQAVRAATAGTAFMSSDVVPLLHATHGRTATGTLTAREREVLQGIADGRTVGEIAATLHLSQHTVRNHIRRAMGTLGVHRRLDAVVAASQAGLIELPT
jgi:DNA-binding NarL/FixJ family response regulator